MVNSRVVSGRAIGALVVGLGVLAAIAPECSAQGTMYACRSSREFYSINPATGAATQIGSISAGVTVSASLAHDCNTGITYVSNTFANVGVSKAIYTLNLTNAVATRIGPYGDPAILMHGIEVDTRTGALYGMSTHNGGLYGINKTTGAATLIALTDLVGTTTFASLGFDSDNGIMYVVSSISDSLYRLNLTNGEVVLVGPLNGPTAISALAYNADTHTMYLMENSDSLTPKLYTVNLATGAATFVAQTVPGNFIGLVHVTTTCPTGCVADFDDGSGTGTPDGGVTIDDLIYYLGLFEAGDVDADVDDGSGTGTHDGGVTIDDLIYYLTRFEAGC